MNQKDATITKIKSKGYWMINIHPEVYQEKRITSRSEVKEIVRNAVVSLKGWDYPHFFELNTAKGHELYTILNGIESFINFENNIEFWRMTQSANFVHLLALREDWMKGEVVCQNIFSRGDELKDKKLLGVHFGTLYTLTEIFEFTKRLAKQNIFDEKVIITIELHDLSGRQLFGDLYRLLFRFPNISKTNGPWRWGKSYLLQEILNKAHEFSFAAFIDLVGLFGWEYPPIDNLKNDQQKFLQGKI